MKKGLLDEKDKVQRSSAELLLISTIGDKPSKTKTAIGNKPLTRSAANYNTVLLKSSYDLNKFKKERTDDAKHMRNIACKSQQQKKQRQNHANGGTHPECNCTVVGQH